MARKTYTHTTCIAGCFTCKGTEYIWASKNAMALAARHHDKTGHPTWADQNLSVHYGDADNSNL
jgi:hypothetical protein